MSMHAFSDAKSWYGNYFDFDNDNCNMRQAAAEVGAIW